MDKSSTTVSDRDPHDPARKGTFANRIEAEQLEAVAWMNQHLIASGQSEELMTDLAGDIADGVTLLRVVEAVAQERLPRYNTNPLLRVQKQENMQMCLQFLKTKGMALKGVHAEDLVGGNLKSILSLFHLLKQHFTESVPTSRGNTPSSKRPSSQPSAPLAKNDLVLAWISDCVDTTVSSYSSLRDGKTLCALINSLRSLAIPNELAENGSSEDRLKASLVALERHLGVKGSGLNIQSIVEGRGDDLLQSYLGHCMVAWQQTRGQRKDDQTLKMAVRATVKRLTVPGGVEVKPLPHLANPPSQERRSAEMVSLPVQATPTIPSISVTPSIGGTPVLVATPTEPRPDKISRSTSVALPGQQVPRLARNPGPGHRRGHSDASTASSKEVWSLASNGGDDFVLSGGDDETEMERLTSLASSPSGSARHLGVSPLGRTRNNQGIHSPSEKRGDDLSPSQNTEDIHSLARGVHSPSERAREVLSGTSKDRVPASPRNLDFHPDSTLPKSELGAHKMGEERVPSPISHSNSKPHDSRTGVVFKDHAPGSDDTALLSATIASETHARDFSTLPDRNKQRAEEQLFPIARRTFSSPESLAAHQAMEGDVLLATEPSKHSKPHVSPLKRSQSSAGSKINTSTISLDRPQRMSSISRLDYESEVSSKIDDLHERVTMLAAVVDSERRSLLKHSNDTVMKERMKREALEHRVRQMETSARKLHEHYNQCFLQLASQISTLRAQIADHHGDKNGGNARSCVEELGSPEQSQEDSQQQHGHQNTDCNADSNEVTANDTVEEEICFFKQGTRPANPKSGPFFRGSEASFRKLLSFFGEEPPRLLTTREFLRSLNYGDLYERFKRNRITLSELKHINEPMLEQLGIPLGPRLRILAEVKTIEQHHCREHVGHGEEGPMELLGSSL